VSSVVELVVLRVPVMQCGGYVHWIASLEDGVWESERLSRSSSSSGRKPRWPGRGQCRKSVPESSSRPAGLFWHWERAWCIGRGSGGVVAARIGVVRMANAHVNSPRCV